MSEFKLDDLQQNSYVIQLDPDPEGWIATATRPFRDGTAKQASLWIAFAIMVTTTLVSMNRIPWRWKAQRRFHILPLIATFVSATFYLMMALGYHGASTCKTYHLASSLEKNEPDDWQPGAVEGRTRLDVCRPTTGLDRWEWRTILILWIGQFVTQAVGSLSSGSSAFGIITALDIYDPSDSDHWNLFLKIWRYGTGAFFVARSIYQMITHKDARARKFFFCLAAYASALVSWWARGRVFPSSLEYIAYAIIDILISPGISLWLLHADVPNAGADFDRAVENGRRMEPSFNLSQTVLVIHMAQVALWYHGQGHT